MPTVHIPCFMLNLIFGSDSICMNITQKKGDEIDVL
jgi:hypothetical protein